MDTEPTNRWYCDLETVIDPEGKCLLWCIWIDDDINEPLHVGYMYNEEHAERIVACVNACAGIANPAAVPEVVEALRAVEWYCESDASGLPPLYFCPWCGGSLDYGHHYDCPRQAALAKLDGEA